MRDIEIILGSSVQPLGNKICETLGISKVPTNFNTFSNGEREVEIGRSVRDADVFVIQSSSNMDTNDHLMELFLIQDALKRSSCYRVTIVMPNYPYARQDRKVKSRVPVSAKLLANLLQEAGMDRFMTAELHSPQISGFFDVPVDNLYTRNLFLPHIRSKHNDNNICMVAPDAGSMKTAKMYAGRLGCEVAMIYKNRSAPGEIAEMNLIGDVNNKNCIIVDDMADTCGTLCRATELLIEHNASSVEAYCTHSILSGNAISNLESSFLDRLYLTDTVDNHTVTESTKIKVLSADTLFAEAISCIHEEKSLSHLFDM